MHRPLLLSLALALSCATPEFPVATPDTNAGETLTAEDVAIYDAIVAGYAREGLLLGACAPPPPGMRHPLTPEETRANSGRIYLEPYTRKLETAEHWMAIPPELGVPPEAARHFLERNRRKASLDRYRPRDLAPVRSETEEHSTKLALTLPGYSPSGDAALVCVFCTNAMPFFGTGDYVSLRKENGEWRMAGHAAMWIN